MPGRGRSAPRNGRAAGGLSPSPIHNWRSGKTTSIKAAAGLIRPSSGHVRLGASGLVATDPNARVASSFLPQRVSFPGALTGAEVLEFHRGLRGGSPARVREVVASTGLGGAIDRAVGTYSGGMIQRLGLAVAMLPESAILLLDEPTAALDPDGLCAFYALIESRRKNEQAVFFSSHQMGDVERLADRFAILAGGRLVASFTASELTRRLADRGVLKIALNRQSLNGQSVSLLESVRRIAPSAVFALDQLIVPAPTARRLEVLDLVRTSGVEIRGLTAQDGRLDALYSELVSGAM